jgi:hypothetical protein
MDADFPVTSTIRKQWAIVFQLKNLSPGAVGVMLSPMVYMLNI